MLKNYPPQKQFIMSIKALLSARGQCHDGVKNLCGKLFLHKFYQKIQKYISPDASHILIDIYAVGNMVKNVRFLKDKHGHNLRNF